MKQTTEFTADYFIQKYTKIPRWRWITGMLTKMSILHCAYGFCKGGLDSAEATELEKLFKNYLSLSPDYVNDFWSERYPYDHPKDRILAALGDIKILQLIEQENIRISDDNEEFAYFLAGILQIPAIKLLPERVTNISINN